MKEKNPGTGKALQKIKHYCAYQERNQWEVRKKLYGFGLQKDDVDTILTKLIEENYLNEERYAITFARGKFNVNNWGRIKIKYALKQNKVSDYCIKKALSAIDAKEYMLTLRRLCDKKQTALRTEKESLIKKQKLFSFLLQKGFEQELINEVSDISRN